MKNLLKSINTAGRETTPFITANGRFLFLVRMLFLEWEDMMFIIVKI